MARYGSGKRYSHRYGNLLVTVRWQDGEYLADIQRLPTGEVLKIGTGGIEKNPMAAAHYALQMAAHYPEWRADALEALQESEEFQEKDWGMAGFRWPWSPKEQGASRSARDTRESMWPLPAAHEGGWDVFKVIHYDDRGLPLKVERKFAEERDARDYLQKLDREGRIPASERDRWGIEQERQVGDMQWQSVRIA